MSVGDERAGVCPRCRCRGVLGLAPFDNEHFGRGKKPRLGATGAGWPGGLRAGSGRRTGGPHT